MEKTLKQQVGNCLKIVMFGPESTGKTTLAKQLAAHYKTEWVPEYMRSYLQEKWDNKKETISKDDLLPIAQGQIASENSATKRANEVLFCDTNLLELQVYCEYYYNGWCPTEIKEATGNMVYDLYFLTGIDIPWQKDDLRDRPLDRSTIFRSFENSLKARNLPFIVLKGTKEERLHQATAEIHKRFRI